MALALELARNPAADQRDWLRQLEELASVVDPGRDSNVIPGESCEFN